MTVTSGMALESVAADVFRAIRRGSTADAPRIMAPLRPLVEAGLLDYLSIHNRLMRVMEDAQEDRGNGGLLAQYFTEFATGKASAFREIPKPGARSGGNPTIQIKADNLAEQIEAAESALIAARLGVYQRDGVLVRVSAVRAYERGEEIQAHRLIPVNDVHLAELMGTAATWERYDARAEEYVPATCPRGVAQAYLARSGIGWQVPHLTGLIHAPTLRSDCSVLDIPGYDGPSRLFLDPRGMALPEIPATPTLQDAHRALALLLELVDECAFVGDADEAVAISAILTALVRRSLAAAPLHAFTAPTPGTGKSYVVDIASHIATGRNAAGVAFSADDAENRKQLDAALLEGATTITLDNVTAELSGARLNQVLTQPEVTVRPLGQSKTVTVPCAAFIMANGNNLVVAADMTRRVMMCRLDRRSERPELHEFTLDPLAMIAADRGAYVAAALTILRAYHIAGRPNPPPALGGFEDWSSLVRGALLWVGLADPVATIEAVRANDPRRNELAAVLHRWNDALGNRRVTTAAIITAAQTSPEFREALLTVAGAAGAVNTMRLGRWLAANAGKPLDGLQLDRMPLRDGLTTWALTGGRAALDHSPATLAELVEETA